MHNLSGRILWPPELGGYLYSFLIVLSRFYFSELSRDRILALFGQNSCSLTQISQNSGIAIAGFEDLMSYLYFVEFEPFSGQNF